MNVPDFERLTLFREDFPASPSVWLESKKEKKMTVTYGLKCSELSENCVPNGLSEKTCLDLFDRRLQTYYPDLKKSAIKRGHTVQRLGMLEDVSGDKGLLLWPRPTTGAPLCAGTGNFHQMEKLRDAGIITEEERRNLVSGNGGKSNPALLEWLMGFPIGWTDLSASEMP